MTQFEGQCGTGTAVPEAIDLVADLIELRADLLYASPYLRAQKVMTLFDLYERMLSPVNPPDWRHHIRKSFVNPDHAPEGGESCNNLCFRAVDPSFGYEAWQTLQNSGLFDVDIFEGPITTFAHIKMEIPS